MGFFSIAGQVLFELFENVLIDVQIEFPFMHNEGFRICVKLLPDRDSEGTPAAKLRRVFFRLLIKRRLVVFAREEVRQAVMLRDDEPISANRLSFCKISDRVTTLKGLNVLLICGHSLDT